MRVNRTLLYTGIFLVAIGGVVAAADMGVVRESLLRDTLRLWPLAVIGLGLGLVLRHTRVSLASGMLAAAVPGLLLGSVFALVPRFSGLCTDIGDSTRVYGEHGAFSGRATVSVTVDCGSLRLLTGPGREWRLDAQMAEGGVDPEVVASARRLSIASANRDGWLRLAPDDWALALPTDALGDLALTVNAGRGDVDLADAVIDGLAIEANASEVIVDASTASVTDVTGTVNFGELSIRLPAADLSASIEVDAGRARVCVPEGVGLRVASTSEAGEVTVAGVHRSDSVWQSADYASAEHRVDLGINVHFGAVEINPIGGCR